MRFIALAIALFIAGTGCSSLQTPLADNMPAGEAASVHLSPADNGYWRADYIWEQPVTELGFVRGSNKRRPDRLQVVDRDFEIFSKNENDVIRRRDGANFNAVSILEPISIENPPAGYLPFAQYGDGGILLHTGRFHACAGVCPVDVNQDEGPWRITLDPGDGQRMILNGEIIIGAISFSDTANGTKVYVGNGDIISGPSLLTVIDTALPNAVVTSLNQLFPPLMDYFGERLGALDEKQMLFASYNVPGDLDGFSVKGGALPNQVFIHFEGAQIPELSSQEDFPNFLAWFFAHEASHLFQNFSSARYDETDSWIHEGAADAFAYLSLQSLQAAPAEYLATRLDRARSDCASALTDGSLHSVLERGQPFQAFYDCGLILHLAADAALRQSSGGDLFAVWTDFERRVADGSPWSTATYLEILRDKGGEEAADFIEAVVTQQVRDPSSVLNTGLTESGFVGPTAQ